MTPTTDPTTDPGPANGNLGFIDRTLRTANDELRRLRALADELTVKNERLEENLATMYSDHQAREFDMDTVRAIVEGRAEQPANMLHLPEPEWKLALLGQFLAGRSVTLR